MKKGNNPVYPTETKGQGFYSEQTIRHAGLTKRELFAAMAMQGLCANPNVHSDKLEKDTSQFYATCALNMADELLKQLEL